MSFPGKNIANNKRALGALAVFIGGVAYGFCAPAAKLGQQAGLAWQQTFSMPSLYGLVFFTIAFLVSLAAGKRWQPMSKKDVASVLILGVNAAATNLFYNMCLARMDASLGVTLLFQYVWMGVALQVILTRKAPRLPELAAVVIVLTGTICASGIFGGESGEFDPLGVVFGLLSGLCYATFLYLSGIAGTGVPPIQRGLVSNLGAAVVVLFVCPWDMIPQIFEPQFCGYGIVLGAFALFLPVLLMGLGAKHLTPSACNVLASAELPCSFFLAVILLGDPVDVVRVVGVVLILVGIVVSQIGAGKS